MENMPALLTSTCSGALRLRQRSANARTERSDARSSCSTCAQAITHWLHVDRQEAGQNTCNFAQFAQTLGVFSTQCRHTRAIGPA